MTSLKRMLCVSLIGTYALLADSWTGWLTDAKCAKSGNYAGDLHKKCVESGQAMVFVNEADKSIHPVTNAANLAAGVKDLIGQKVTVEGTANQDGSIELTTAAKAAAPSAP